MAVAPGEVALRVGAQNRLARQDLVDVLADGADVLPHSGGAVAALEDDHVLLEHFDARGLLVHGGHHGDAELLLDSLADVAAGDGVTAGLERGTRDEEVHRLVLEHLHDAADRFLGIRAHEVVAADDRVRDLCILQRSVVGQAGTDRAFDNEGLLIGFILAADTAEKLIQIQNHIFHVSFSPFCNITFRP